MSIEEFVLYCVAIFAVSIIPGPSMALAFSEGTKGGMTATVPAALGNVAASLGQGTIAYLVFRSIISLEPQILQGVQAVGALYIAYVGSVFIRHGNRFYLEADRPGDSPLLHAARFRMGFLVAFFNPKAILFFVALFPQFVQSTAVSSPGYLGAVFAPIAFIALVCFLAYGYLGQISLRIFEKGKMSRWIIPGLGICLMLTALLGLIESAGALLRI
ncbi:LysE family translocator [Roseibium sp. Sym1]|uniref:LysE family translocator n=1 Tax=Roseibium sp. Sym1 TaxID=3016006 RepID=UPI0022B342DA|nr:LysE family translocator [Roseibium sp. Sym1]